MRHMYSHPGEYRKVFLANYLCIGFVPGGMCAEKEVFAPPSQLLDGLDRLLRSDQKQHLQKGVKKWCCEG